MPEGRRFVIHIPSTATSLIACLYTCFYLFLREWLRNKAYMKQGVTRRFFCHALQKSGSSLQKSGASPTESRCSHYRNPALSTSTADCGLLSLHLQNSVGVVIGGLMQLTELRVTKSNELIQASYKLTLNEQRLILASIGQLDGRKPPPQSKAFKVHAQDFARTFSVDMRDAYAAIKDASDTLYERDIRTYDGLNRERFRWVQRVRYVEGEGYVELWFSDAVLPYLTLLHTRFTTYNLREIAQLRSIYAIRLFEMLMQFKSKGLLIIKLEEFRERLELTGQYDRFDNLRARVIEPAVRELQDKASLEITWRGLRDKRKVVTLEFRFKPSDQLNLPI